MFDYESIFHAKTLRFLFGRVSFENGTFMHHRQMLTSSIGDIQNVIFRVKNAIFENVSVIYSVHSQCRAIFIQSLKYSIRRFRIKSELFK